jgi:hypothetical protein
MRMRTLNLITFSLAPSFFYTLFLIYSPRVSTAVPVYCCYCFFFLLFFLGLFRCIVQESSL